MTEDEAFEFRRRTQDVLCGTLVDVVNGNHWRCICSAGHLGPHETRNGNWYT